MTSQKGFFGALRIERRYNSVITSITGPFVRYSREFVITVNIYVAKWSIGAKNGNIFYLLQPWIRYNRDRYNRVWLY